MYRAPDTDCGALRERGHGISVQGGYQYQNVLTPLISKEIISKLGVEEVAQIYSGDDHDYCEIEHGEFTGRIKEITVKSMSLAMGVRKPGFLAVSLHNPVDVRATTNVKGQDPGVRRDTIQNHLCLLPDQLAIFLRYVILLFLTLLVLAAKAVITQSNMRSRDGEGEKPLLPLSTEKDPPSNNGMFFRHAISSNSSSSSPEQTIFSGAKSAHRTPRSGSPRLGGYGNLPAASRSSSPSKTKIDGAFAPARGANVTSVDDYDDDGRGMQRRRRRRKGFVVEFGHSTARVALPVLGFYVWLIMRG